MASSWPPLPNPIVLTSAGAQPQQPGVLWTRLIDYVSAETPGYTILPAALVEDVAGTAVGAVALCDQAWVDLLNSISPYTANPYILNQLGQIYGPVPNQPTNTSVYVTFSGPAGFVVGKGFMVGDGTYQYQVQDGGIIGASGATAPLFAIATLPGTWAVPEGTVTQLLTSVPSTIILSVNNLTAGLPGNPDPETEWSFRSRTLQAGLATGQGTPNFLKTQLGLVSGVQQRLIGVRLNSGLWEVIVGGGDPYEVAYAIYIGLGPGIASMTGSTLEVIGITKANPGVVTTNLNHGYTTGQVCEINGILGMTELNGVSLTATVLSPTTFSIGIDTTGYTTYVSGGVVTPNLRNIIVDILDFPDTYAIPFVLPPQEIVEISVVWNTTDAADFVSNTAVAQLATPALVQYVVGLGQAEPDGDQSLVTGIIVGQPMNLFELQKTFQLAVESLIPTPLLTRMVFSVSINGLGISPESGTGILAGDPESYLYATAANITVTQG